MIRSTLAAAALAASLAAQSVPFTLFRDIGLHGHVSVETRNGQPVVVIVGIHDPAVIVSWHRTSGAPWPNCGADLYLREVTVLETRPCVFGTNVILLGPEPDIARWGWTGPVRGGLQTMLDGWAWFPDVRDQGTAGLVYCDEWEPSQMIFRGPCGGNCYWWPRPQMWAVVFDVRVL